jgi:sulfite exporter TauE/SafE
MPSDIQLLLPAAASIALLHTIAGPDHYLPFIALAKTRNWCVGKTIFWVITCGCGHVWSSVLLGLGGAALGWSISSLQIVEGIRGGIAGWALLVFGLAYMIWGFWNIHKNKSHKHFDQYENGELYVYEHKHGQAVQSSERHKVTPWVMFLIFLLGPCEPMIPLLFYPAAQASWSGMLTVIITYTICTLIAMIAMVLIGYYSINIFKSAVLERFMHPLGGAAILICGIGMVFIGW